MHELHSAPVSLFQTVSNEAETDNALIICVILPRVSLFQGFGGRALAFLIWRLRPPTPSVPPLGGWEPQWRLRFWARNWRAPRVPEGKDARIELNTKSYQFGMALRGGSKFRLCRVMAAEKINAEPYSKNPETAKQRAVFDANSDGCLFHLPLKQLETVKQRSQTTSVRPPLEGAAHA